MCDYKIWGARLRPPLAHHIYRGFIYFETLKTFGAVKKLLPDGAHIERTKGNAAQNRTYCAKEGAFEEAGNLPVQGHRTDIQTIKDMVRDGEHILAIAEVATSYQTLKFAQTLLTIKPNTELRLDLRVHWFHGGTGTERLAPLSRKLQLLARLGFPRAI